MNIEPDETQTQAQDASPHLPSSSESEEGAIKEEPKREVKGQPHRRDRHDRHDKHDKHDRHDKHDKHDRHEKRHRRHRHHDDHRERERSKERNLSHSRSRSRDRSRDRSRRHGAPHGHHDRHDHQRQHSQHRQHGHHHGGREDNDLRDLVRGEMRDGRDRHSRGHGHHDDRDRENGRSGEDERRRRTDRSRSRVEKGRTPISDEDSRNSKRRKIEAEPEEIILVKPQEEDLEKKRLERMERWKKLKTASETNVEQLTTKQPPEEQTQEQTQEPTEVKQEAPTKVEEAAKGIEDTPAAHLVFDGVGIEKAAEMKDESDDESESGPDLFGSDDIEVDEQEPTAVKAFTRVEVEPSDDTEGYYSFRLGEILGGKYVVVGYHGQGVFSNVLKCQEVGTDREVAVKLLRNNEHMKRTGKKEVRVLRQLRDADPEGKSNNIRLLNDFEDRDHLCLVFEPMDCNLRQLLKKYGGKGISVVAVRFYASKLLRALSLLYNCGFIHADFKPDNILVNKDRTQVKLADLGSALELSEVEPTPYLVSRFYRAPEIILGLEYGQALDIFSLGTCLYELATGKPLLKSRDNNHHLKLVQELKGPFPRRLIQKAVFREQYFDETMTYFLETTPDPLDNTRAIVKKVRIDKPTRSISKELQMSYHSNDPKEKKYIALLADLIERCTEIDPSKRLTPQQAMRHDLFKE